MCVRYNLLVLGPSMVGGFLGLSVPLDQNVEFAACWFTT